MIVRELTGDVYFGKPRGVTKGKDGKRTGVNTMFTLKMKFAELPFAPSKLPERVKEISFR